VTQLKEDERRQGRLYLPFFGFGVFAILVIIAIIPVAITQKKSPAAVEFVTITEAPSYIPSASPTTTVFVELLSNIERDTAIRVVICLSQPCLTSNLLNSKPQSGRQTTRQKVSVGATHG
jgi:hypothetical protein